ncbi:MAG TPA: diguanylate cyclase [Armatimonadota bacterium]|nr:diguanylate cyclase [Armatimonadota bacterium]
MDELSIRHILVVEDDPDHAMLAMRTLHRYFRDVTIQLATSAEEGEALLADGEWDAVVVDYGLPCANGLHLLEAARDRRPHLPIVMLTGRGDEQTAVAAMKGGAADYVTKTGDYLALLPAAVDAAVRRSRVAADRERLARELEQRNRHLAAVSTVAVAVSRSLHLDEMLQEVVTHVTSISGLPAALFLPDGQSTRLRLAAHANLAPAIVSCLENYGLPVPPAGATSAGATVRVDALAGLSVEPRFFSLAADGEPQGLLAVFPEKGRTLDAPEAEMLVTLAHVVGMGVRNSLLFEETRSLSLRDELTGLGNRRLFNIKLQSDFNTARRYGTRLALLMLDIDHFKAINDCYGHPSGDWVLRRLAAVLLERSRSSDLTFRYGGEEFAMLLPHTSDEAAVRVAERVRRIVAAEEFAVRGAVVQITVSIGIGCYREAMADETELINAADRALYGAKQSGRNCVCLCDGNRLRLAETLVSSR